MSASRTRRRRRKQRYIHSSGPVSATPETNQPTPNEPPPKASSEPYSPQWAGFFLCLFVCCVLAAICLPAKGLPVTLSISSFFAFIWASDGPAAAISCAIQLFLESLG